VARKLVYKKVRNHLGLDNCRGFYSGAAPLNRKTLEFFLSLDMPIYEAYGLTECSGVNCAYLDYAQLGVLQINFLLHQLIGKKIASKFDVIGRSVGRYSCVQ
jgi:acyl-CoA synthetase (AMP-forming)/AMP-acid ligase II